MYVHVSSVCAYVGLCQGRRFIVEIAYTDNVYFLLKPFYDTFKYRLENEFVLYIGD